MEIISVAILLLLMFFYIKGRLGKKRYVRRTSASYIPKPFDSNKSKPLIKSRILSGRAHVIDGDSLVIKKIQVRLFGVDAPEINHPYGQKAKWALVSLCKGHVVRAEVTDQDDHGRTVAKCYLEDGRDISAEMVKMGLAIDWPKYSGGIYKDLELPDVRKKLWLANARQKGQFHVWEKFEARQNETK